MTRAMTTVVSNAQTSVITASSPMKMKLRPITLALLETGIGRGMVKFVKSISGLVRAVKIPTSFDAKEQADLRHEIPNEPKTAMGGTGHMKIGFPVSQDEPLRLHLCERVPLLG